MEKFKYSTTLSCLFYITLFLLNFNSSMSALSLEHTAYASEWEEIVGSGGSGYVKKIDNTSNVTGVILVVPGDSFSSDGTYNLVWDDSEDTLTWGSGSAVNIDTTRTTALTYYLDDGSGGYVAASVKSEELPVGDASDSITVSTVVATNGFALGSGNESLIDFIEYKGYLYAGIEGYPGGEAAGVYRSKDGITWSRIIDQAFWGGATDQDHVDTFMIFNGELYFSTGLSSGTESGTQVWKSIDGISWQSSATGGFGYSHNENGQPGVIFDNYLYFSTFNGTNGTQIWRTNDGINWSQSGTNGLGYSLTWIDQFIVYNNYLYAFRKPGSSFPNSADGQSGLVFRTSDGANWSMIKQFPANQRIFKAIVYNGYIYGFYRDMSLTNWQVMKSEDGINWEMVSYDTGIARTQRLNEIYEYNGKLYLISETDGIIWASSNGADWYQINITDFGDTNNNAFYSVLHFKENLYVGFFDNSIAGGLEIWRLSDVISAADTDYDGIPDNVDNCPTKPNGPNLGTCMPGSDKAGATCNSAADCVIGCSSNGKCSLNQEDTDGNGIGDVCDESLLTTTTTVMTTTTTIMVTTSTTSVQLTTTTTVGTTTTTAVQTPSAPSNLKATAISSSQINLNWTDKSANETGFKIEQATSLSGPYSQIATVSTNVNTYQNAGLKRNTTYFYRVHAYNAAGNSGYSNTASATTLRR